MPDRRAEIDAFLEAHGFAGAARRPLAGDASVRRYERITAPWPAVLMDCPPDKLDVGPFLRVQALLAGLDFSVPAVLAADPERGLILLEDLGDTSFSRVLAEGENEERLYGAAVDLLAHLQRRAPAAGLPAYDETRFMAELDLLPAFACRRLPAAAHEQYRSLWRELLDVAVACPRCFVYVDFHADNLHWLEGRPGHRRIGLLDFQDARAGPPAYDLVSLLEDARRDVPRELADKMIERFLARRPELDPAAFEASCAILGAQRNSKIVGLFRRLAVQDGKRRYLDLLPRVEIHLRRDLEHAALASVRAWYQTHLWQG